MRAGSFTFTPSRCDNVPGVFRQKLLAFHYHDSLVSGIIVYMHKLLLPFLVFLLCHACANPGPGDPPAAIERLVPVVRELQLAEALSSEIPAIVRDSMRGVLYDKVLADHGLDRAAFDSLLWRVRAEPAWIDSLYAKVGEQLSLMEAEE